MLFVRNVFFDNSVVPSNRFSYFSNFVFNMVDSLLHVTRSSVEHFQRVRGTRNLLHTRIHVSHGCSLILLLRFIRSFLILLVEMYALLDRLALASFLTFTRDGGDLALAALFHSVLVVYMISVCLYFGIDGKSSGFTSLVAL